LSPFPLFLIDNGNVVMRLSPLPLFLIDNSNQCCNQIVSLTFITWCWLYWLKLEIVNLVTVSIIDLSD